MSSTDNATKDTNLELSEETIAVSRRTIPKQTVRIDTTTSMREQHVEEKLEREIVKIERVAVGRVVETTPEIRDEGDITIIPVMEEVLVLERRLVLKEEIRVQRVRTSEVYRETVQLRDQTATITRSEPNGEAPGFTQHTLQPLVGRESP